MSEHAQIRDDVRRAQEHWESFGMQGRTEVRLYDGGEWQLTTLIGDDATVIYYSLSSSSCGCHPTELCVLDLRRGLLVNAGYVDDDGSRPLELLEEVVEGASSGVFQRAEPTEDARAFQAAGGDLFAKVLRFMVSASGDVEPPAPH